MSIGEANGGPESAFEQANQEVKAPIQVPVKGQVASRAVNKTLVFEPDFTQQLRDTVRSEGSARNERMVPDHEWVPAWEGPVASQRIQGGAPAKVLSIEEPAQFLDQAIIIGFLVSYERYASGEVYALRQGRRIISSKAPQGSHEYIVIEDPSIVECHASINVTAEGKISLLDHFSGGGTAIRRSGEKQEQSLHATAGEVLHGDVLRLGERHFKVCLV